MAFYVDGFVLPLPKGNVDAYRRMARKAGRIWIEHGALQYVETIADDVQAGTLTSFPQAVQLKADETVVFAWAVYRSRAHRDKVLKKVMSDPRLQQDVENMPFDGARMFWGGFRSLVALDGE